MPSEPVVDMLLVLVLFVLLLVLATFCSSSLTTISGEVSLRTSVIAAVKKVVENLVNIDWNYRYAYSLKSFQL